MRGDDLGAWPHDLLPVGSPERARERARIMRARLSFTISTLAAPAPGADFTRCCECSTEAPLDPREWIRQGWCFTEEDPPLGALCGDAPHDDEVTARRTR